MKPKDLKYPYSWSERRPILNEGVLFVPRFYEEHQEFTFPKWEEIFENSLPVKIEFCSGNGSWLAARAKRERESNWVGVEVRFDRARKIWSKGKNLALGNLFVVCGEAHTFSSHYLPEDCIDEVFINFPDPWPKKRHEKHRLMKQEFLDELSRILKSAGKFTFVTDDPPYLEIALALFQGHPDFQPLHPSPHYTKNHPDYGTSFFDTLWREKGREIHYVEFERV